MFCSSKARRSGPPNGERIMFVVRTQRNSRNLKLWQRRTVLLMLFLVFIGTFTMHSTSTSAEAGASSTITHSSAHTTLDNSHGTATTSQHHIHKADSLGAPQSRYCSASSCYPNEAPIKLMQLMSCVAALIALALALLIPTLKKLRTTLPGAEQIHGSALAKRILHNTTPSLISLSISRT